MKALFEIHGALVEERVVQGRRELTSIDLLALSDDELEALFVTIGEALDNANATEPMPRPPLKDE